MIDEQFMSELYPSLTDETQRQCLFFQNETLTPGYHTLVITNLVPGGKFYLDRIDLTPISSSVDGQSSSDSKLQLGLIVGAVLGTFFATVLMMYVLHACRRYRQRCRAIIPEGAIPYGEAEHRESFGETSDSSSVELSVLPPPVITACRPSLKKPSQTDSAQHLISSGTQIFPLLQTRGEITPFFEDLNSGNGFIDF